jgi:hypothetical protein
MSSGSSSSTVFLGTFTGGPGGGMASDHGPSESEGIYTAAFNADTGVSELCPASSSACLARSQPASSLVCGRVALPHNAAGSRRHCPASD